MKNVEELLIAVNRTIDSALEIGADKKLTLADLSHVLDDIPAWREAIDDLHVTEELRVAKNAEVTSAIKIGTAELTLLDEDDKYDVANIEIGVLSLIRIISRKAYKKGLEARK